MAQSVRIDADEWGDVSENPKYMKDIHGMGEYAWAEALCRILMEAVEGMYRKLEGPVSDVQINGFSLLIQVKFH